MKTSLASLLAYALALGSPATAVSDCSTMGNKTIEADQLYPENASYDPNRCVVYFSALYNVQAVAWDPNSNTIVKYINIPGLTTNTQYHASGVRVDPLDRLSIIVDAGIAFDTLGAVITGDNYLVKWDLASDRVIWQANLSAVTNGVYGGFQDVVHDATGNSYALGTFPSSIIKVDPDGNASPWYLSLPADHTKGGFTGLVTTADGTALIVVGNSQLFRIPLASDKGVPVPIPLTDADGKPIDHVATAPDAMLMPEKFSGNVILLSDDGAGTWVIQSSDGLWNTAQVRGVVHDPQVDQPNGGVSVATFEFGDRLFSVTGWLFDKKENGKPVGNRREWPILDITADVDRLLL